MSAEEEIPVEPSVEDQLAPENAKPTKLNKNGKPRKVLSPEALEKLKLAREKANAIRKESYTKKLEEKVEKLKQKPVPAPSNEEETTIEEEVKEEIKEIVKAPKPKGKKKTKIIVEQSSDDSDEFEPNDNVVFVKRVSRKKKDINVVPVVPEPQLQMEQMPPEPPPKPPPRQLTPQELMLQKQYNNMFSGGFINKRSYY
jgi:hypothetical protein